MSGKEWVGDLVRDDSGTVDIIAGGEKHPEYISEPLIYNLGDPQNTENSLTENDNSDGRATRTQRLSSELAKSMGKTPKTYPEDRWIAEAAIRMINTEDPDLCYVLLAGIDNVQHAYGAADRPEEWTDPGTPGVLRDDKNIYNDLADREAVLNVVHEADMCSGEIFDLLRSRNNFNDSIIVFLADHGQVTIMDKPMLSIGDILLKNNINDNDIDYIVTVGIIGYIFIKNPDITKKIESILENHWEYHPVLKKQVHPFVVINREEMDSGIDNIQGVFCADGIHGNKRGEYYSEWNIDYPVNDNSKVKWPDLIVFVCDRFQVVCNSSEHLGGKTPFEVLTGAHDTPLTTHVPLIIHAPFIKAGVINEKVTLADIVPTFYKFMNIKSPEQIDGKCMDWILVSP
ncbi:MAG: hypothetical protein A2161_10375 [Candidatus Schekmanbacteria bacterium RBG_13_48_7]|uniref:Sulfatase N-terminal domain-containing protein n=1 Tax=Candidatus Schekmanbacteria bacterium RBG_13_48_7 TaxID=1817878 RepID=A0A1F7S0M4_9BACT|nr:MAG: hypothetical protein A2161_10375 [Candidatus Schekmanbacteria bacterium RBG_13_48_7]